MDRAALEKMLSSIKHPGGKQFAIAITKAAADEIILTESADRPDSVKSDKQKRKTIFQEVVDCITAQNPYKKKFGLCISERKIKKELFVPFCKVLESNKHLSSLSLVRCQFTSDECYASLASMLKNNTSMTSLNLSQTSISTEGVRLLAEGLKDNTTVSELFLDNIGMNDESAIPFAEILVGSSTQKIKTIDLAYNSIGPDGFDAILKNASNNIRSSDIRVKGNPKISSDKISELESILRKNKCIAGAIDEVLNRAFTQINVAIRVSQTAAIMATQSSRNMSAPGGITRGRSRGGTIDMSSTPAHLLNATSACEPMEDCGNSKSTRYIVGESHTRGRRKDMQDATLLQGKFDDKNDQDFFCVFDGHGSQDPAIYAAKNISPLLKDNINNGKDEVNALCEAFVTLNEQLKPTAIQCGTTAVVCWIKGNTLFTANVGDSRAVLCRKDKAIRLTVDHKPDLPGEKERIEFMGGAIKNNRVQGALAVTRALGDWFAGELVSPEPYVTKIELTKEDPKLIIACDGLFDVFSDDAVVDMIKSIEDPQVAATKLKDEAFNAGSMDNISVVVIHFKDNHKNELSDDCELKVLKGLWKNPNDLQEENKEEEEVEENKEDKKEEETEEKKEEEEEGVEEEEKEEEKEGENDEEEDEEDETKTDTENCKATDSDVESRQATSKEELEGNPIDVTLINEEEEEDEDSPEDGEGETSEESVNNGKVSVPKPETKDDKVVDETDNQEEPRVLPRKFSAILVDSISEGDSGAEPSIPTEYASAEESDTAFRRKVAGEDLCTSSDA